MKLFSLFTGIAMICLLVTYTSCTTGGDTPFKTKADSLRFAKTYFDTYPGENNVKVKYADDTKAPSKFGPITWQEVKTYAANYDTQPLISSPASVPLKGFVIDTAGYNLVKNNKFIKGLYLRFGKKDDGTFTIMVLGTDASGTLMKDSVNTVQGTNYDNTPPCPALCPKEPK